MGKVDVAVNGKKNGKVAEEIEMETVKPPDKTDEDIDLESVSGSDGSDKPKAPVVKRKIDKGAVCMKFLRKHPCGLLVCAPLYAVYVLALPIAMIAIGAIYFHECPREKYLPLVLILGGVPGIIKGLVNVVMFIWSYRYRSAFDEGEAAHLQLFPMSIEFQFESGLHMFVLFVCDFYLLIWFFAGAIVVYSMDVRTKQKDAHLDLPCNATLYMTSFWVVTSMIFLTMLSCGVNFCWRKDENN